MVREGAGYSLNPHDKPQGIAPQACMQLCPHVAWQGRQAGLKTHTARHTQLTHQIYSGSHTCDVAHLLLFPGCLLILCSF